MAEVTEVVFLTLKEGSDPESQRFKNSKHTILKNGGPHRIYAGQQVEHPNVQTMFIDWPSIDHHMQFTKWEYGFSNPKQRNSVD